MADFGSGRRREKSQFRGHLFSPGDVRDLGWTRLFSRILRLPLVARAAPAGRVGRAPSRFVRDPTKEYKALDYFLQLPYNRRPHQARRTSI
jgi:hypothetical protein